MFIRPASRQAESSVDRCGCAHVDISLCSVRGSVGGPSAGMLVGTWKTDAVLDSNS
jgi:hypothetical protein